MDDNNAAGNSADDTDNDDNNDDDDEEHDDNQCKCKYTHNQHINQNHTYIQSHHTINCIINKHMQ